MIKQSRFGIYDHLLLMRTFYLYSITFMVMGIATLLWWFFFYAPLGIAIAQGQAELNNLQADIAQARKVERTLIGISQSIDAGEDVIAKQHQSKMLNFNAQESLALVIDHACHAGMSMKICKLVDARVESHCYISKVMAECVGSLEQIISFFELMDNASPLVIVARYDLAQCENSLFSLRVTCDVHCVS